MLRLRWFCGGVRTAIRVVSVTLDYFFVVVGGGVHAERMQIEVPGPAGVESNEEMLVRVRAGFPS